jgi:uncharacterized protein YuzE
VTAQDVTIVIDDEVDAAYVTLQPIAPGAATTQILVEDARLAGNLILDLDPNGRLLGIEFLGYRSLLAGHTPNPG